MKNRLEHIREQVKNEKKVTVSELSKIYKVTEETIRRDLEKLEKAYLLHRCSRFDLQGKEILKTQEKFYLADASL